MSLQVNILLSTLAIVVHQVISFPIKESDTTLSQHNGCGRRPTRKKELFNYYHASLWNVIERCFGILKAKFPILKLMPPYSLQRQREIVIAACTIHNFIKMEMQSDRDFIRFQDEGSIVENNYGYIIPAKGNGTDPLHCVAQAPLPEEISVPARLIYLACCDEMTDNKRIWKVRIRDEAPQQWSDLSSGLSLKVSDGQTPLCDGPGDHVPSNRTNTMVSVFLPFRKTMGATGIGRTPLRLWPSSGRCIESRGRSD
ncbi:putative nuclease HARBI1 [Cinnamomum micranthum f. kanehirae]|uniref:Putative nuclease HARBI1 n=1 Tax=Cinnamomum micranthum f. kanehirae TaxID=337451 RepID=A0A3S3PCT2_9MAGN|nr:putative nuclease HARBI1 [Cinnamomum micranthum f. kanehirae]